MIICIYNNFANKATTHASVAMHMFHGDRRADGEAANNWTCLGTLLRGFHILSKMLSAAVDCSAAGDEGSKGFTKYSITAKFNKKAKKCQRVSNIH